MPTVTPVQSVSAKWFDNSPDFDYFYTRWESVTAVVNGAAELQRQDLAKYGTFLIEFPDEGGDTVYWKARNDNYIKGATFVGYTAATLTGYLGMLFRTPPTPPKLPKRLEYILLDSDGNGLSLEHLAKNAAEQVIKIGRQGLLCDMPPLSEGQTVVSIADQDNGFRARFKTYTAVNIPKWMDDKTAFILYEPRTEPDGEFKNKKEILDAWRILRLTDKGYTTEVVDKDQIPLKGEEERLVLDGKGKAFKEIPFVIIGSVDNQPDVDPLPLEDISVVNIRHYRNLADLESSSREQSAPTLHIADDQYSNRINSTDPEAKKQVVTGERGGIVTRSDGKVSFVQANPNTLAGSLAESKEKQIIALGAQVVTPNGPAETAEASRIHAAGQTSQLHTIGGNVGAAFTQLLNWAAQFNGIDEPIDGSYELNKVFFDPELTPEQLEKLVATWLNGAIPMRVMHEKMQTANFLSPEEDLEKLGKEIDFEGPTGFDEDDRTG